MPTPRKNLSAATWRDSLIYCIGGIKPPYPGIVLRDVELFNPSTNTWTGSTEVDGLIQARKAHASGIIGDEIIVSMGKVGVGPCIRSTEMGTIDPLNPGSISWSTKANLPFESRGGAGTAANGFFYIHLGDSCGPVRGETYRYNPRCNLWESLPDKPTPVTFSHGFVAAESLLFFIGGFTGDSASIANEALSDTVFRDLGLSMAPLPDTVYPDSTYTPIATVWNCGNVDESFEIICIVDSYEDTMEAVSCFAPSETTQVFFSPWTVPSGNGATYIMTCFFTTPDGGICPDTAVDTFYTPATGIEEEPVFEDRPFNVGSIQIQPNPFQHSTSISFTGLPSDSRVSLKVYDITGRMVKTLMEGNSPGFNDGSILTLSWDGRDEGRNFLPPGIYFLKLKGDRVTLIKKAVLLR
jgi:hypothetical protein